MHQNPDHPKQRSWLQKAGKPAGIVSKFIRNRPRIFLSVGFLFALLTTVAVWMHITNPYAAINIVQQPYTTKVQDGQIVIEKQFDIKSYDGPIAQTLGYWVKNSLTIAQNTFFGGDPIDAVDATDIVSKIYQKRFDPSKPYLISGDQFSVLYPRNLGVFYNDLLNPNTARDQKDWQNRQRIYLQSALYALDAFSSADKLTTTIEPISARSVLLVQVHPGSVASDSLYGLFYALKALTSTDLYSNQKHQLQTVQAVQQIIQNRRGDLKKLLSLYLKDVQDQETNMVKQGIVLSGARDGIHRQSSFYDNVIMWRTLGLAKELGVSDITEQELRDLRADIINTYWNDKEGHFADDLQERPANDNYSSDWLIVLPTGFLNPDSPVDQAYLQQSIDFVRKHNIAKPLPIKYTGQHTDNDAPWAIRTFAPNYGSNAIWSYWGAQYLTLLADMYHLTKDASYKNEAQQGIDDYSNIIERVRGFPETLTPNGDFLHNTFYKSIRQTGWVVQFETAQFRLEKGY